MIFLNRTLASVWTLTTSVNFTSGSAQAYFGFGNDSFTNTHYSLNTGVEGNLFKGTGPVAAAEFHP